jgi:hypothetical protein
VQMEDDDGGAVALVCAICLAVVFFLVVFLFLFFVVIAVIRVVVFGIVAEFAIGVATTPQRRAGQRTPCEDATRPIASWLRSDVPLRSQRGDGR